MRHAVSGSLFFLLALALLAAPAAQAEETTRVFDAHNFKWTVPDGWEFSEFSDQDKELGYIIRATARKDDAYMVADVRVKPSDGLSIQEISNEVRDWHAQQMTTLQGSKVRNGSLSGIKGTEVLVKGEDETGTPKLISAFTIDAKGTFHQLIFKLYNGAETKMAAQIDAARRGYRLLKGAGPMEQPAEMPSGDDEVGETGTPDNWPEKGPKIVDDKLHFPSHNFNWQLDPENQLKIYSIINDETLEPEEGKVMLLVGFKASVPREAKKDGEPTKNEIDVRLLRMASQPGFDPNMFVQATGLHNNIAENLFDSVEFGRTKASTDHEIGNYTGGRLAMAGRKDNMVRYFLVYAVSLKGMRYQWEIRADGGREAFKIFQDDVKKLMKGLEFLDTAEWITGPAAIMGVPPFNMARGDHADKERKYTSVGFTVEKPEGLASVEIVKERKHPNHRYAWEMRSEDKSKYFFFDVHSFPLRGGQGDPQPEQIVKERELQWKEVAQNPDTVKKGKTPWFKAKLGRGKGVGYEFRGYVNDETFVEKGFVVKYKKYLYWFRFQFGGDGAEAEFKKLQKTVSKGIKF